MSMTFGERLKKIRDDKGLSRQILADKAGVNYNTIYQYEKEVIFPRLEQITKLANVLGVSQHYLAGFDNDDDLEDIEIKEHLHTELSGNASVVDRNMENLRLDLESLLEKKVTLEQAKIFLEAYKRLSGE